jgi:hypothetical protein
MILKFEEFLNEASSFESDFYIHTTTPEIAKIINERGFDPKNFIEYKYFSLKGKSGIYFYKNYRLIQVYAYFIKSKIKDIDKVALIYCKIPKEIISSTEKEEDGFFVNKENLNKIKIVKITFEKPINIY